MLIIRDQFRIIISLVVLMTAFSLNLHAGPDVSSHTEYIGSPFAAAFPGNSNIYPRNIWDMQLFGGKIYMGAGNSSNFAPNSNAGAGGIRAYTIAGASFAKEFDVNEEQIDVYRVLGGSLAVPGHDSTESWALGNYYRYENSAWVKYRNVPHGIHVYDILQYNDTMFAAEGTDAPYSVCISTNYGISWSTATGTEYISRAYSLFNLDGKVYATSVWVRGYDSSVNYGMFEYQGGAAFVKNTGCTFFTMFPNAPATGTPAFKIVRPTNFKNKLLYIGGVQFNDHQVYPYGAYCAGPSIVSVSSVPIAAISGSTTTLPWDIIARDDAVYVLLGTRLSSSTYRVSVISSSDTVTWSEVLHFSTATFARSFELDNGDFYFGLGAGMPSDLAHISDSYTLWDMSPAAGNILRVREQYYQPPDSSSPTVPAGLYAVPVSSSQINIAWSASSDNVAVTGYNVYRNGNKVASPSSPGYADMSLSSNTAYTYAVDAFDAEGNTSALSTAVSTRTWTRPPIISGVAAGSVCVSSAVIRWVTDTDADSRVSYGATASYGQARFSAVRLSDHAIVLDGLSAGATYHFQVRSTDGFGQITTDPVDRTFTTVTSSSPASLNPAAPGGLRIKRTGAE